MADREYDFPIDRFNSVASWMSEVTRKINALESEVQRLREQNKVQAEQITGLTEFAHGVQLVTKYTEQP